MATLIAKEAAHGPAALHGTRAGQLAAYITDPHKCGDDDMRSANLYATTVEDAAREMAAICDAADGTGKRKLIQHWIISTRREGKEDHPANGEIMAAGRELMAALGYAKCPHMIAIHNNTDNRHAHIVVARVDADTGQIVHDSHTHIKAQKAVATISAAHGWRPERGNMWQIAPDGEIVTRAKAERDKPRRGDIRTRTTADDTITPPTPRQTLEETLAEFVAQTRKDWGAWKWGDLHRALALHGIEMQYTDHGDGRGGLAYSADGRHWIKASSACPAMSYPALSAVLGAKAGSYRRARKGIAQIAEVARQRIKSGQGPELSTPVPQGVDEIKPPRQEVAQDQPGAAAPDREERRAMTDEQMRLRKIVDDAIRQQRDVDRSARSYRAYKRYATHYAGADTNHGRIIVSIMRQSGMDMGNIAARMIDGMTKENEREKNVLEYCIEETIKLMYDIFSGNLYPPQEINPAQEELKARIAYIEDYYGEMSAHAPAEHQEYIERRKQEEIAAARAMYQIREDRQAERARRAQEAEKMQREQEREDARIKRQIALIGRHARIEKHMHGIAPANVHPNMRALLNEAERNIRRGHHTKNAEIYAQIAQYAAIIQTAKEVVDPRGKTTPEEAAIYARHAGHAQEAMQNNPEKMHDMIALRLRACGHHPAETVRILRAGGMDAQAAMLTAAGIYHTDRGDNALRAALNHAERWKREERGEQQIRRNGGATQAQRPAPAAAAAPRM